MAGRPRKEIDRRQFEKLCAMQCSGEEVRRFFDVSDRTLCAWCRRTYGRTFAEERERHKSIGKARLRRAQFEMALKNPTMAIWLGKQWLGQTDCPEKATDAKSEPVRILLNIPMTKEEARRTLVEEAAGGGMGNLLCASSEEEAAALTVADGEPPGNRP